jgi:hypothetical protein
MEKSVNTKLAINLSEGTVQVEGDEAFVRFIYQDFKESLSKHVVIRPVPAPASPLENRAEQRLLTNETKNRVKRPATSKKAPNGDGETSRSAAPYKPKFNSKLNLAGLAEFYDELEPENNTEKIVVFAVFLRDRLQMERCSADDIYTCFFTLKAKTKIPEAFPQAFKDAKRRTHLIDFELIDSIEVTIAGDNWLSERQKKRKEQAK